MAPDPRLPALIGSANEELLNRGIRHAVLIDRLAEGEARKILSFLNDTMFPAITERAFNRLNRIGARGFDADFTTRRHRDMIAALDKIVSTGMGEARNRLAGDLVDIGKAEAAFQVGAIRAASPVPLDLALPPVNQIRHIVAARPFRGAVLGEHFKKLTRATQSRIREAVQVGMTEGVGPAEIVRRLKGLEGLTRHQTASLVRTATNSINGNVREESFAANRDVIKGVQYVAALDTRTTLRCASLDGQVFDIGVGPRPSQHFGCRSTTVPVLKSWKELGINLKEAPPGTRFALNGKVPSTVFYPEWLAQQPFKTKVEALGVRRAQLFDTGRLSIKRMVNNAGRPLSIAAVAALEGDVIAPAPTPKLKTGAQVRKGLNLDDDRSRLKELREQLDLVDRQLNTESEARAVINATRRRAGRTDFVFAKADDPLFAKRRRTLGLLNGHALAVRSKIHDALKVDGPRMSVALTMNTTSAGIRKKAKEAASFLSSITSASRLQRMEIGVRARRGRGRPHQSRGTIFMGSKHRLAVYLHEMGHAMEYLDPQGAGKEAVAFLVQRRGDEPLQSLRQLTRLNYKRNERAWPDEFIDAYMGKQYRAQAGGQPAIAAGLSATEITSMGLELLHEDPLKLIDQDPGMFDWLVNMLRGL